MVKKFFSKKIKKVWIISSSIILLPIIIFAAYNLIFLGKIYPGIFVAGINAQGFTPLELAFNLSEKIKAPEKITLTYEDKNFELPTKGFDLSYDFAASSQRVYNLDRTGNLFLDFLSRVKSPFRHEEIGLATKLDDKKLASELSDISDQISTPVVPPSIKLVKGKLVVDKGKEGKEVDIESLRIQLGKNLAFANSDSIELPIKIINGVLSEEEVQNAQGRGENLINNSFVINFEFQSYTYKNNDLFVFLNPKGGYNDEAITKEVSRLATETNRAPQNPVFNFTEGKVQEFEPARDGVEVETDELKEKILSGLKNLESGDQTSIAIEIPVTRTPPEIQTGDVNDLGIKQLIGRGTSHFRGSITSRIYNIKLAASRINGALVKPGEVFSFVNTLGDVSNLTGYQQAYIIQGGRTILGDGGGVCQVSTTFFRAALAAGLPILERRAHSYRVGYYEQDSPPGFDATVYYPTTDLKVRNDTPGHILIQSHVDTKNSLLVFEIYGTSDGRTSSTTKPKISDQIEPPADLYQDDPTLPAGTVKQVDYKAWGAKVVFNYKVERAGETIYQKTFTSVYQPWQAVYLRGTGPSQ